MQDKIASAPPGSLENDAPLNPSSGWAHRNEIINKARTALRIAVPVVALGSIIFKGKDGLSYAEKMMGKLIHWETGETGAEVKSFIHEFNSVIPKAAGAGFIWLTGDLTVQVSASAAKLFNNMTRPADKAAIR